MSCMGQSQAWAQFAVSDMGTLQGRSPRKRHRTRRRMHLPAPSPNGGRTSLMRKDASTRPHHHQACAVPLPDEGEGEEGPPGRKDDARRHVEMHVGPGTPKAQVPREVGAGVRGLEQQRSSHHRRGVQGRFLGISMMARGADGFRTIPLGTGRKKMRRLDMGDQLRDFHSPEESSLECGSGDSDSWPLDLGKLVNFPRLPHLLREMRPFPPPGCGAST